MDKSVENLHFKWVSLDDKNELMSLFADSFGNEINPKLWEWKYSKSMPSGVAIYSDSKALAHYGGIARKFCFGDSELTAVQIADVMVAPHLRGIGGKKGAFFDIASTFIGAMTGEGKAYSFAFGFPHGRAAVLGEKLGLYAKVDEMKQVEWALKSDLLTNILTKTEVLGQESLGVVDGAWEKMRASLDDVVAPVKDSGFVEYRYFGHPVNKYEVVSLSGRFSGDDIGVIVLRKHDDGRVELCDMICEAANVHRVVKAAAVVAKSMGGTRLFGWFTPTIIVSLPKYDAIADECSVTIAAPELAKVTDTVRGKCWLMSGDTDFR
jgi:Acetyltransferase (GNAT) domain